MGMYFAICMCIKGTQRTIGTCLLCRRDISADGLEEGVLEGEEDNGAPHKWFYSDGDGWWQYNRRSQEFIERAFCRREPAAVEFIIVGHMYDVCIYNCLDSLFSTVHNTGLPWAEPSVDL